MRRVYFLLAVVLALPGFGRAEEPRLILNHPSVSASQVAFGHAGDLWVIDRSGGSARRLTAGAGLETHPVFSPGGSQIAFAAEY
jgi:tricorn protease